MTLFTWPPGESPPWDEINAALTFYPATFHEVYTSEDLMAVVLAHRSQTQAEAQKFYDHQRRDIGK